jgi:hypothetical protein
LFLAILFLTGIRFLFHASAFGQEASQKRLEDVYPGVAGDGSLSPHQILIQHDRMIRAARQARKDAADGAEKMGPQH